jgi:hypothetical protein
MKKQMIAAAVAASVSAVAVADISITGNANYEYFQTETTSGTTTHTSDTEVNLSFKGKNGDTSVVANLELDTHGGGSTALDVEDTYLTTKIGDINVKAGNFASGTSALGGEIDAGGRSTSKMDLSTEIAGVKLGYAVGSSDTGDAGAAATLADNAQTISVSTKVAGWNVAAKQDPNAYTIYGVNGEVAGISVRAETKNSKTANSDVTFLDLRTKVGDVTVGYAMIDADTSGLVGEEDSSVFAREMATGAGGTANARSDVDGVNQFMASTSVDGTAVTVKLGELRAVAGNQDAAFAQIAASRKLASGTTLSVIYTDAETESITDGTAMTDTQTLEIDLAVSF